MNRTVAALLEASPTGKSSFASKTYVRHPNFRFTELRHYLWQDTPFDDLLALAKTVPEGSQATILSWNRNGAFLKVFVGADTTDETLQAQGYRLGN